MGLQLRMKKQADEIIPLLKASSYRCKGAPVYDPYSPDPRHKAFFCLPLPTAEVSRANRKLSNVPGWSCNRKLTHQQVIRCVHNRTDTPAGREYYSGSWRRRG